MVVGNALSTVLSGKIINNMREYKVRTACGNISGILGCTLLLLHWDGNTKWFDSLFVVLSGLGMGVLQSATFVHLAASLRQSEVANAGTSWFLTQSVGALAGASMSILLINKVLRAALQRGLSDLKRKSKITHRVTSNVRSIRELPEAIQSIVAHSYVRALLSSDGELLTMRERPL